MNDVIWDSETYPNCFLLGAYFPSQDTTVYFEISDWVNDIVRLIHFVHALSYSSYRMVGFNNLGFDYPILHRIMNGLHDVGAIYELAQAVIRSENKLEYMIWPSDRIVEQIDLFKIHHFDNKARSTSLKALEFNMRMDNISNLPFPVGKYLTYQQVDVLRSYLGNDLKATYEFYQQSTEQIRFREQLSEKYRRDFMNFSDVRIGKEIFQIELENNGVQLYERGEFGRQPRQTKRHEIQLISCIPSEVKFTSKQFINVHIKFMNATIRGTKGQFNCEAYFGGLDFKFGTGGLHASVSNKTYKSDSEYMIYDIDVKSLYPSIAIEYGYYPEHLGEKFVDVYRSLREQRFKTKKGTPENAMLKLALNGVYGASSDIFSVFYDPLFTMRITVAGQLLIAMLAEQIFNGAKFVELIQVNTDGITMKIPRDEKIWIDGICADWEKHTKLELEKVEYETMAIADVNSYLAIDTAGNVKRKGRYEYDVEWHQDASALVVAKVAEQVIINGLPIKETVKLWPDKMDFMLRVKVPRSSRLVGRMKQFDIPLENVQRYYVARKGVELIKIMPPLPKKPGVEREFLLNENEVWPCNDMRYAFTEDNINYHWYIDEVVKLVHGVNS